MYSHTKILCNLLIFIIFFSKEGSSETAYICDGSDFSLMCSTNGTNIEWLIVLPDSNATEARKSVTVLQSLMLPIPTDFFVNNSHFQFSKSSNSPLTSTMLIDSVSSVLDRVTVNCVHQDSTTSTFIRVIKAAGVPNTTLTQFVGEYGSENVTVLLEYSREPHTAYNVTVLDLTTSTSRAFDMVQGSSIQLNLSYNTMYRVGFVATRCGLSSKDTLSVHYVKCDYPVKLEDADGSVLVTGYSDPALVGTNITISCLTGDGDTGNGAMVLTCMDDGQWDPDPQLIGCICRSSAYQQSIFSTPHATEYTRECDCDATSTVSTRISISHGTLAAVIVSVILLGGTLFIFGSVSGCLCQKYKHFLSPNLDKHRVPEISGSTRDQSELEMTENVAYGPVKRVGRVQ